MTSPFPPNTVLTFSVTNGFTNDPKTGNKVPVTTSIAVEAYLKADSRPRGLFYPGIDEQEEPLTGRAIEALPDGVANLSKAWAVITDPVTGKAQVGHFTLYRGTPSAFGTEAVLGPKIAGVFRAIAGALPPLTTAAAVALDFSQSQNSQYLGLFALGLIGSTAAPNPSLSTVLDFSQSQNSQYLGLLSYGVIGR